MPTPKYRDAIEMAKPKAGKMKGHLMVACGYRIVDRALQELRDAGKISFLKDQWELTGHDSA